MDIKEKDLICENCLFYRGKKDDKVKCLFMMEEFIENNRCGALALNLEKLKQDKNNL